MIRLKKLHPEAKMPLRANEFDVGFDLFAVNDGELKVADGSVEYLQYRLGFAAQIVVPGVRKDMTEYTKFDKDYPEDIIDYGRYFEIVPRSSISNYDLSLCNSVGIVDPTYLGEWMMRFRLLKPFEHAKVYKAGDRIGQAILRYRLDDKFEWVDNMLETKRGTNGFGSTGS